MSVFAKKKCEPCNENVEPLSGQILDHHMSDLGGNWVLINDHHLEKEFQFKNFKDALDFANRVGELCESEGHHPDLHISWGRLRILLWTHKINGLSANDFIIASKIDLLS